MDEKTMEWLKDTTYTLKIQKGNAIGNNSIYRGKSEEWLDGFEKAYDVIIEQFEDLIKRKSK